MGINLQLPGLTELRPRITVIGVGGAGGNAVNNMIDGGLEGVEFLAANTDAQALSMSSAGCRIQLGIGLTEGLGAGSKPEIGAAAAEEALDEIRSHLDGVHLLFITAGMGGGTGTGAAPVIAKFARDLGILTVGVVTTPFEFEGQRRMRLAREGVLALGQHVDTMIVIPNQNLFRVASEKTTFADAFMRADDVLRSGVSCITDLMMKEGLINLDFADVRTVMQNMGPALMGTGEAEGDKRALQAAEAAISNPLLGEVSMRGAKGLLVSITGSFDMTLYEVEEAASRIKREVDPDENPDVNIIVGATFDTSLQNRIRVSVVATGIQDETSFLSGMRRPQSPPPSAPAPTASHAPPKGRDSRLSDRLQSAATPHEGPGAQSGNASAHQRSGARQQPVETASDREAPMPRQSAPQRRRPDEGGFASANATEFNAIPPAKTLRPPRRPLTFQDFPELREDDSGRETRANGKQRTFFDWVAGRGRTGASEQTRRNVAPLQHPSLENRLVEDSGAGLPHPPVHAGYPRQREPENARSMAEDQGASDQDIELPSFFNKH